MSIADKFNIPQSLFETIVKMNKESAEYQAKVKALMAKKGIKSLGDLSPEEKKDFFNTLDAMHQAKNEEIELDEGKVKELMMDINVVASKMEKNKMLKPFAGKFVTAAKKSLNIKKSLEDVLPDYISGAEIAKLYKEEIELEEGKSGTGYELYHKDFSSAMAHAYDFAKKKYGIEVDPEEIDQKVAMGPKRPSSGKTNSYRLMGKDGKKAIQVQVANLDDKRYELNMYKEEVELDEEKMYYSLVHKTTKKVKSTHTNLDSAKEEHRSMEPGVRAHFYVATSTKNPMKKEELEEGMSSAQVAKLRQEYEKIDKIDPASDNYKKLTAMLDKLDTKTLQQLASAKIKFVSGLAQNRIVRRMNEEQELTESHFKVGDEVECIASGMEGEVVKLDEPQTGKYYTVKREDGKMVKYAPDELRLADDEDEDEDEEDEKDEMDEASSPAQQAAIAIAMKKAGKKPKNMKEMDAGVSKEKEVEFHKKLDTLVHKTFGKRPEEMKEEVGGGTKIPNIQKDVKRAQLLMKSAQLKLKQQKEREALSKQRESLKEADAEKANKRYMVKFEKDGSVKVREYEATDELSAMSKASVDAKRMGMRVSSVRLKEEADAPFAGAKPVKPGEQKKDKYGNVIKNIAKHLAKRGMEQAKKSVKEAKKFGYEKYKETSVKVTGKTPEQRTKEIEDIQAKLKQQKADFEARHAKKSVKENEKEELKTKQKNVEKGDSLSGKKEPITINPEMETKK